MGIQLLPPAPRTTPAQLWAELNEMPPDRRVTSLEALIAVTRHTVDLTNDNRLLAQMLMAVVNQVGGMVHLEDADMEVAYRVDQYQTPGGLTVMASREV